MKTLKISLLAGLLLVGCAGEKATIDPQSGVEQTHYVMFGEVLCLSTDQMCLRERFDRCLGQSKKKHYFENGPPNRTSVLPDGEMVSEWLVGSSDDRIRMTYTLDGIARQWEYRAAWGSLQNAMVDSDHSRRTRRPAFFPSVPPK